MEATDSQSIEGLPISVHADEVVGEVHCAKGKFLNDLNWLLRWFGHVNLSLGKN